MDSRVKITEPLEENQRGNLHDDGFDTKQQKKNQAQATREKNK